MTVIQQFNTTLPAHFEANRTQVNVGIVPKTKTTMDGTVEGYEYFTVCFEHPQTYTDAALFKIAKKEARSFELSKIVVTTSTGLTVDGDETSQERLSRAYVICADNERIMWKDANNIFVELSKADIKEAVLLAGTKQTELWVKYE